MELQLISGRFAAKDAEQILTDIFKVKIEYHHQKIRSQYYTEENIKHAEKRILQLEETLRSLLERIRKSGKDVIDVNAHVEISLKEPVTQ